MYTLLLNVNICMCSYTCVYRYRLVCLELENKLPCSTSTEFLLAGQTCRFFQHLYDVKTVITEIDRVNVMLFWLHVLAVFFVTDFIQCYRQNINILFDSTGVIMATKLYQS